LPGSRGRGRVNEPGGWSWSPGRERRETRIGYQVDARVLVDGYSVPEGRRPVSVAAPRQVSSRRRKVGGAKFVRGGCADVRRSHRKEPGVAARLWRHVSTLAYRLRIPTDAKPSAHDAQDHQGWRTKTPSQWSVAPSTSCANAVS